MKINKKNQLDLNQTKKDQADLDEEFNKILEDEGDFIDQSDEEQEEEKKEEENDDEKEEENKDEQIEEEEKEEEIDDKKEEEKKENNQRNQREDKSISRPKKYIPISKYQEDKKNWKETKEELEKANEKIAELEKANNESKTKKEKNEKLKELADKYDTSVEFLEDLVDTLDRGEKIDTKTITEEDRKNQEEDKNFKPENKDLSQDEIVENFNKEFETFVPGIKDLYPKATQEQIDQAKEVMDQFAHSEEFSNTPLNHIIKINQKDFDDILGTAPKNQGLESGRSGGSGLSDTKSKPFKKHEDGTYDFSKIHKMADGTDKNKAVDELPLEAWEAYINDVESESETRVRKKDGRIISLK